MITVHRGFDGFDVSFEVQIPNEFADILDDAKEHASENKSQALINRNGLRMLVNPTGTSGGYSYTCDTGPLGAIWFFKKPNPRDTWGVRASVKSMALAKYGLVEVQVRLLAELQTIGIEVSGDKIAVSRLDYAVDILAPDFQPQTENFVCHSRSRKKTVETLEYISSVGRSSRTTSVTVGSNPNKQVIIYDKREEVLSKADKAYWWEIWNSNLAETGLETLDSSNAEKSRIWRFEFRAYKRHLVDECEIRSFNSVTSKFGNALLKLADSYRYCEATSDQNRSRWPDHEVWRHVKNELTKAATEITCSVAEEVLCETIAAARRQTLMQQFVGLAISLAGLDKVPAGDFKNYATLLTKEAITSTITHKVSLPKRIEKSGLKHSLLLRAPI